MIILGIETSCDETAAALVEETGDRRRPWRVRSNIVASQVDLVVVGADRIAANGDVANKIGTYGVAVLAKEHGIPFYVAAPWSTIDLSTRDGDGIPIEQRAAEEVTQPYGRTIAPAGIHVFNPAFDVTPAKFVTAIITERGIARPPYTESLAGLVGER